MLSQTRLLFDLKGWVRVRNVLSDAELSAVHAAIDARQDAFAERTDKALRNTQAGTPLEGNPSVGRMDLAGALGWSDTDVFRKLLCHEKLVPYLHLLVGKGYRLDHSPLILAQNQGSEGFTLHGGPIRSNGDFDPTLQYVCRQGSIFNSLLAVSFQFSDHNKGDGGFCVVSGSHKMNFPLTSEMLTGQDRDFWDTCVEQPETKAGDVIIFSEATVHGSMPWTCPDRQRRIGLFRFAPAGCAFARGYSEPGGWPEEFTRNMTPAQLAVMQPPYHPMYDRDYVLPDNKGTSSDGRSAEKKAFDMRVFGRQYY